MEGFTGFGGYKKYGNGSRCRGIKRRTWTGGGRNKRQVERGRVITTNLISWHKMIRNVLW